MSTDTIPSPAVKECPNCGSKMFEGEACLDCGYCGHVGGEWRECSRCEAGEDADLLAGGGA